jgi:polar amino acid transport system permease protein
MSYKFDFEFLAERWPDFVAGAWLTIQLTVLSIAFGFLVGTVCALARVYGGRCCAAWSVPTSRPSATRRC